VVLEQMATPAARILPAALPEDLARWASPVVPVDREAVASVAVVRIAVAQVSVPVAVQDLQFPLALDLSLPAVPVAVVAQTATAVQTQTETFRVMVKRDRLLSFTALWELTSVETVSAITAGASDSTPVLVAVAVVFVEETVEPFR
jgi:hypothetical protein